MDRWVGGRGGGWTRGQKDIWMDEQMDGPMDGMDGWTDRRMAG